MYGMFLVVVFGLINTSSNFSFISVPHVIFEEVGEQYELVVTKMKSFKYKGWNNRYFETIVHECFPEHARAQRAEGAHSSTNRA